MRTGLQKETHMNIANLKARDSNRIRRVMTGDGGLLPDECRERRRESVCGVRMTQ